MDKNKMVTGGRVVRYPDMVPVAKNAYELFGLLVLWLDHEETPTVRWEDFVITQTSTCCFNVKAPTYKIHRIFGTLPEVIMYLSREFNLPFDIEKVAA
jgi:hypothetical protein